MVNTTAKNMFVYISNYKAEALFPWDSQQWGCSQKAIDFQCRWKLPDHISIRCWLHIFTGLKVTCPSQQETHCLLSLSSAKYKMIIDWYFNSHQSKFMCFWHLILCELQMHSFWLSFILAAFFLSICQQCVTLFLWLLDFLSYLRSLLVLDGSFDLLDLDPMFKLSY